MLFDEVHAQYLVSSLDLIFWFSTLSRTAYNPRKIAFSDNVHPSQSDHALSRFPFSTHPGTDFFSLYCPTKKPKILFAWATCFTP